MDGCPFCGTYEDLPFALGGILYSPCEAMRGRLIRPHTVKTLSFSDENLFVSVVASAKD